MLALYVFGNSEYLGKLSGNTPIQVKQHVKNNTEISALHFTPNKPSERILLLIRFQFSIHTYVYYGRMLKLNYVYS